VTDSTLNFNATGMIDEETFDEKGNGFGNVALASGAYDWSVLVDAPLFS